MAWASSNRKQRLPSNWRELRRRVFEIKGTTCYVVDDGVRCENTATDVDHIRPGDDHSIDNLAPICQAHHRAKSSGEGWAALRKKKAIARWKAERKFGHTEKHPGLVPHEPHKHPWMT